MFSRVLMIVSLFVGDAVTDGEQLALPCRLNGREAGTANSPLSARTTNDLKSLSP